MEFIPDILNAIPDVLNAINLLTIDKLIFIFGMSCLYVAHVVLTK